MGLDSDAERIADLHNFWSIRNHSSNPERGFLLLDTSPEKIRQLNKEENTVLVAVADGAVVGYVIAVKVPEMLDSLDWSEDLKATISEQSHIHISEMAVEANYIGKGIGQTLYSDLLAQSTATHFSAYVATAPYRNRASINFHERFGFRAVATFHSPDFCGLKNYSSILFYLNIKNP